MSEAARYGRGKVPQDKTGAVGGSLSMRMPVSGKNVRSTEGDMPPNASKYADSMGTVVPGAGDTPGVSRVR